MALTLTVTPILDMPRVKVFTMVLPETDVVDDTLHYTWGTAGMGNFDTIPEVKMIQDITATATGPTVCDDFSIIINDIYSMDVTKCSVAGAGGDHTYLIAMFTKSFFEF